MVLSQERIGDASDVLRSSSVAEKKLFILQAFDIFGIRFGTTRDVGLQMMCMKMCVLTASTRYMSVFRHFRRYEGAHSRL